MRRLIRFILCGVMLSIGSIAMGQSVEISSSPSSEMEVCGSTASYQVTVKNYLGSTISGVTLSTVLPQGIIYQEGSLSETTSKNLQISSISGDGRTVNMTSNDVVSGDSIKFSFTYMANVDAYSYQIGGGVFRNNVTVSYSGGSEAHQSSSYNILYPALSLINVTPTNQTISSGGSSTRSFDVINAGNGKIGSVLISDVRPSDLIISSVDIGTLNGTNDTITLSSSDFSGIGNGDNYLDKNESITITETITGTSCSDVTWTSQLAPHWGCDGDLISSSSRSSNITAEFDSPNLTLSATESLGSCLGMDNANQQALEITNTGSGTAKQITVDIWKSSGNSFDQTIFSKIDETSFQYKIGAGGALTDVTPTITWNTSTAGSYACLGSNPIGRVYIDLPDMAAGEVIYLYWNMYSCCVETCTDELLKGWKSKIYYNDVCLITGYDKSLVGQSSGSESNNDKIMTMFTETPATLLDGESEWYTFIVSSYNSELPEGAGAYFEVQFTLDPGVSFSGSSSDLSFVSGPTTWSSNSLTYDAGTGLVTATYLAPEPFYLPKSELNIKLTGDCNAAGDGWKSIEIDVYYVPDNTCPTICKKPLICDETVTTYLKCPAPACTDGGLLYNDLTLNRWNYGDPDNDYNGKADGSGSLDFNIVKDNRIMYSDTLKAKFEGVVSITGSSPSFNYGYAQITLPLGSNYSLVKSVVTIYDISASESIVCEGLINSTETSGTSTIFKHEFTPSSLSGACSELVGYSFENGDSVTIETYYEVIGNIGGDEQELTASTQFYLSDVSAPTSSSDKYQCGDFYERYTLIGYYFIMENDNNYSVTSCSKFVQTNFKLSIGDCCSNYAGGDLFPGEYRYWGHLNEVKVVLPPNYSAIEIDFYHRRTKYANSYAQKKLNNISYDSMSGDTLIFDIDQYFQSGELDYSDDGFNDFLKIRVAPNCDVPNNVYEDMVWKSDFAKSTALGGGLTSVHGPLTDRVRFKPSALQITSSNPAVDGVNRNVSWNVNVKNTSNNSSSDNAWFHAAPPANITITDVTMNGSSLTKFGDIYQVGSIGSNSSKDLIVYGTYDGCSSTNYTVYAGYECNGYPATFAEFSCDYVSRQLYVQPQESDFQVLMSSEEIGSGCFSDVEVVLEVSSVKVGNMYDMTVDVGIPSADKLDLISGTSEFQYNLSNSYSVVAEPSSGLNTYSYAINDFDGSFTSDGIPGVLDLSNNTYRLKYDVDLGAEFKSGDYLTMAITGENPCGEELQTINLAFDPSAKFDANTSAGLHLDIGNSWGVAWGDYDNDGYEDLFLPDYDYDATSILYHNNQDGTFTKVSTGNVVTDLGGSVAATWGDYDNDGDLDLFVANNLRSKDFLYQNNGDGSFTKITSGDIVNTDGYSHSASWGDYDNDGYLDLFVADYMPTKNNRLFKNNGDGTFTRILDGFLVNEAKYSIGAGWCDYDDDGDLDIFVCNARDENNSLYRNDGGIFTKIISGDLVTDGGNSVGCSWGDYNNDGYMDLFVANASKQNNFLYYNNGDGTFTKVTGDAVVTSGGDSHGSTWGDYDSDGDLDLFVTNDQNSQNFLYANNGNGSFTRLTNSITTDESNSFGTAWSDFDNDGDLDLFVSNHGSQSNNFFENTKGSCNGYICFNLTGSQSNAAALGAKVRIKSTIYGTDVWQMREVSGQTGGGAGGQNGMKLLFGIGDATQADSVIIEWPSGVTQYMTNVLANGCQTVIEEDGALVCGEVYYDANGDCSKTTGEDGVRNVYFKITPSNRVVGTDSTGAFSVYLKDGTYTFATINNSQWNFSCISSFDVTVVGGAMNCGHEVPVEPACNNPDVEVFVSSTAQKRGFANSINLQYSNYGAEPATGVVLTMTMTSGVTPLSANVPWDDFTGNVLTWNLGTVQPGTLKSILITDSIPTSMRIDDAIVFTANATLNETDCAPSSNSYTENTIVVGAVDPNDILKLKPGVGQWGYVNEEDTLGYKIRFQNVGNYKATNVIVVDSLPIGLDLSTIHNISLSHVGKLEVNDAGVLKVEFKNIDLPDSVSNEPESHGFVQFEILPNKELEAFKLLKNSAAIRFDYNEWIHTNTVFNTVVPAATFDNQGNIRMTLNPNPTDRVTEIVLYSPEGSMLPIALEMIELHKVTGEVILRKTNSPGRTLVIDQDTAPPGIYIVKAMDKNGNVYSGKLTVIPSN